jgi:hypothetical protein
MIATYKNFTHLKNWNLDALRRSLRFEAAEIELALEMDEQMQSRTIPTVSQQIGGFALLSMKLQPPRY